MMPGNTLPNRFIKNQNWLSMKGLLLTVVLLVSVLLAMLMDPLYGFNPLPMLSNRSLSLALDRTKWKLSQKKRWPCLREMSLEDEIGSSPGSSSIY